MKPQRHFVSAVFGLMSVWPYFPASSQVADPLAPLIAQFASQTVQARAAAFYKALALAPSAAVASNGVGAQIQALKAAYPADASTFETALKNLLVLENTDTTIGALNKTPEDESSGDFYANVVGAVASLNLPSTIPALLGAIANGAVATDTLASFGPQVLDGVLALVYSPEFQKRHAAAYTLVTMLSPQYAGLYSDATSKSMIRAGLAVAMKSFTGTYSFATGPFQSFVNTLPATVPGDLNGDGLVNCADLAIIKASFGKKVGQTGFDIRADVNGDGVVNILDLSMEARLMPSGTTCN
jgi:hypothetical protein